MGADYVAAIYYGISVGLVVIVGCIAYVWVTLTYARVRRAERKSDSEQAAPARDPLTREQIDALAMPPE